MFTKGFFSLFLSLAFHGAAVTDISGRGVGMDVVRTNIESIGGTIDITSQRGVGTVVRVRIPLTLAIIPAPIVSSMDKGLRYHKHIFKRS